MISLELQPFFCNENTAVIDAMSMIDKNSVGLVYVTDSSNRLVGSLTDGDIRRYIIRKGNLNALVYEAMNHEPSFIKQSRIQTAKNKMENEHIYSLVVVNDEMVVQDVIFHEAYLSLKTTQSLERRILDNTPVIIMAGGKGTRLYPYTKILPKPLIPIGDVPILERILNKFYAYGVEEVYLTVNYKKEMIKLYFSEIDHPYIIHYIEEGFPMGTAGSISLIPKKFSRPVIITNCDILIEADYGSILKHHIETKNDITIVSSLKATQIPYGVLYSREQGIITSMEEKPQIAHLINTGMYIINPEFLEWIPKAREFHMTDLAQLMINDGRQVGMYPISENAFLDMGEFEEMKRMEERLMKNREFD